jgi:hypothetical protein
MYDDTFDFDDEMSFADEHIHTPECIANALEQGDIAIARLVVGEIDAVSAYVIAGVAYSQAKYVADLLEMPQPDVTFVAFVARSTQKFIEHNPHIDADTIRKDWRALVVQAAPVLRMLFGDDEFDAAQL